MSAPTPDQDRRLNNKMRRVVEELALLESIARTSAALAKCYDQAPSCEALDLASALNVLRSRVLSSRRVLRAWRKRRT